MTLIPPWLATLTSALLLSLATPAHADPTANDIAARLVRGNGFSWEGARTRLRMVLIETNGQRSERTLEVVGRRRQGLLETKVSFLTPSDVAGTRFLTLEKQGGGSEQYIYLPGLKRTRRVVGREREGSFMGSDFTNGDLQKKDDKGAKHEKLPDEQIRSEPTYVIESTPGSADAAGYAKVRTWVRKTDFVALKTSFFDASGKVSKTLYVGRIKDVEGRPTVVEARMQSENGHATDLVVDSLERRDDLPDAEFSPTSLER
jgi:hypothetical protein